MQDFDFCPSLIKFHQICPKFYPNPNLHPQLLRHCPDTQVEILKIQRKYEFNKSSKLKFVTLLLEIQQWEFLEELSILCKMQCNVKQIMDRYSFASNVKVRGVT